MKKALLLLITAIVMFPLNLFSQSFDQLWKQVDAARQKDQPRTEMRLLEQISAKANKEKAYGHLIKAEFLRSARQTDIAPDSLESELQRLENLRQGFAAKSVPCYAICSALLSNVYNENTHLDEQYAQRALVCKADALKQPDALAAARLKDYVPAVEPEKDSDVFDGDLLHVVGLYVENYAPLRDYYAAHGNRRGVCLMEANLLEQRMNDYLSHADIRRLLAHTDSLIAQYADLYEAGELAIRRFHMMRTLQEDYPVAQLVAYLDDAAARWPNSRALNQLLNIRAELAHPQMYVNLKEQRVHPEAPIGVAITNLRNINNLTLKVYRTQLTGDQLPNYPTNNYLKKFCVADKEVKEARISKSYSHLPDYEQTTDSLTLGALPVGIYVLEAATDNSKMERCYSFLSVTDLFLVVETLPDSLVRWAVLNSTTGQPVPKATVKFTWNGTWRTDARSESHQTDAKGELTLHQSKNWPDRVYVSTSADKAFNPSYIRSDFGYFPPIKKLLKTAIFTDRSIYRPGQTVQVSVITYQENGNHTNEARPNEHLTLTLRDANRQEVARQTLTTDSFGKAAATFTLPTSGLTGRFTIESSFGQGTTQTIQVEEYKRPTFEVEIEPYTATYHAGDTIRLQGVARTYSGVPVQGAKVAVNVEREAGSFYWYFRSSSAEEIASDTIQTDSEGRFVMEVPLVVPSTFADEKDRVYRFTVEATVTNLAGESHSASETLPVAHRMAKLDCQIPAVSEREKLQSITFSYTNLKGEKVDAEVRYTIDGQPFAAHSNTELAFPLKQLASGKHLLEATCEGDTIRREFVTFSLADQRPPIDTSDWFYQSADEFPADGQPVVIQVGTTRQKQHVLYTIFSANRIVEQGTFEVSDGIRAFRLPYKEEYGDGIVATFVWVRDGKAYSHRAKVKRSLPSQQLQMAWTTFRDRLTPGQKEEWTLRILTPDGQPSDASLMATLFDKSLNQILPHQWSFNPGIELSLPSGRWQDAYNQAISLWSQAGINYLKVQGLRFSHIDGTLANIFGSGPFRYGGPHRLYKTMATAAPMAVNEAALSAMDDAAVSEAMKDVEVIGYGTKRKDPKKQSENGSEQTSVQLREDLTETAFFLPQLVTDAQGDVALRFTLPESVTTWHFMGLATDRQLRHALIESDAVAQKKVMVQPNMPRFLRVADKAEISAQVFNTTDETLAGTALLQLLDPETEAVVYSEEQPISVGGGQTEAVTFHYQPTDEHSLLICRISASGQNFSDGEQHYLPVMPNRELVTNTYPFTQIEKGTLKVDLNRLFDVKDNTARLTIEYTNNPAWLMILTLPSLAVPQTDNVIDQATALYANSLARYIAQLQPNIRQIVNLWKQEKGDQTTLTSALSKNEELKSMLLSETPWVLEANTETEQQQQLVNLFDENMMQQRLNASLEKLHQLQLEDGSWSWWKGMEGSYYMTTAVSELLSRLQLLVGEEAETGELLSKAFAFMQQKLIEEKTEILRLERKGHKNLLPSETTVRFLYLDALCPHAFSTAGAEAKEFMIKRLVKVPHAYTIYGKATTAVIFAKNKQEKKAEEYLQSMKEYQVYKEEMGRYYDTRKAYYSWFDYRIPTQVAAIEALQMLQPDDRKTITEMQRWLLQEKRTQQWSTPINTVNASYAFLRGQLDLLNTTDREPTVLRVDGEQIETARPTAGLGYIKSTIPVHLSPLGETEGALSSTLFNSFEAEKTSDGTSWGALYAQFMQESAQVKASKSGMKVQREILNRKETLHVGDRIVVRLTIEADRDYDFVQVEDRRAACMEPVNQLSGYHFGYYIAPQDNATNYYFDRLPKGKHVIETEYFIDRAGRYTTGTCTAQCAYSPEYMGRSGALIINVEP